MFFRLRFRSSTRRLFSRFTLFATGLLWCPSLSALELGYAPEAVFVGEPLTFRLESTVRGQVTVHSNAVETATHALGPGAPAEITLFPAAAVDLRFSGPGGASHLFRVVRPNDKRPFRERDGFLEVEGAPVVLLPDHRKPPPLDRRWETAEIVRKTLVESRKVLEDVLWIAPPESTLPSRVQPLLTPREARLPEPGEETWFRVHAPLLSARIPRAPFLVVEIDGHDLERGVAPHVLFVKWQFVLQHLRERSGFSDGLLFGPVPSTPGAIRDDRMTEMLQSLARSHGLRYIDRSLPEAVWRERMLHQLQREYKLP